VNCYKYNANTGAQQGARNCHATRNKNETPERCGARAFFSNTVVGASSSACQHFVDQAIVGGFVAGHEAVAVSILVDLFHRLAGALGEDLVQALAQVQDFLGLDFDVRSLALRGRTAGES
jgi:hypothetical protein